MVRSLPFLSNKPSKIDRYDDTEFMAAVANVQECCGIMFFKSMYEHSKPNHYQAAQVPDAHMLKRCAMYGTNASWPLFEKNIGRAEEWSREATRCIATYIGTIQACGIGLPADMLTAHELLSNFVEHDPAAFSDWLGTRKQEMLALVCRRHAPHLVRV